MELGEIKQKVIEVLKSKEGVERFEDLISTLGCDQSALMRAVLELKEEGFVDLQESDRIEIKTTPEGRRILNKGLPECKLAEYLKEKGSIYVKDLDMEDKNIAIAWAKKKGLVAIKEGKLILVRECSTEDKKEVEYLKHIGDSEHYNIEEEEEIIDYLKKRRFIEVIPKTVRYVRLTKKGRETSLSVEEESIKDITPEVILNETWKKKPFKEYNIYAQSYNLYPGKKHFVNQAIQYIRQIWLDMGFEEMRGNLVVNAFWNFDALFVPQNHPAREMQDTFYVDGVLGEKIDEEVLTRVKVMHEKGDRKSRGWRYKYDEKKSTEVMLRTHTTVLSALQLYDLDVEELPKKYFAIGKVFRNETLDWKHLFEFYQVEGIVVGENLNFRHLLGYLKEFFKKMGYPNIRIRPAYFPYTEMSVEVEVLIPTKGWTELGGAGIFRPEVVKPLIGEEIPVLAWGLGLERIIMNNYNFKDIRDVYSDNINLLRNTKRWIG